MLQPEIVALKLARILIPRREHDINLFFMEGARDLLAGWITASFLDRGEICLRDLRNAIRTKEGLREMLERHKQTRFLAEYYLTSEHIFREILAVLECELARHEDIAGLTFRP